ncbi:MULTISPECIES: hypothetical protein [Bradyrhizobium]|uniref:hypothetical protein n=1 Tax=Bradyrhizobium elkanii TaxID=29448 RepID=UPI00040A8E55|nr:hypothetical protein [Bradyrhizobium elkanii]
MPSLDASHAKCPEIAKDPLPTAEGYQFVNGNASCPSFVVLRLKVYQATFGPLGSLDLEPLRFGLLDARTTSPLGGGGWSGEVKL